MPTNMLDGRSDFQVDFQLIFSWSYFLVVVVVVVVTVVVVLMLLSSFFYSLKNCIFCWSGFTEVAQQDLGLSKHELKDDEAESRHHQQNTYFLHD